jgi:hypothetical protein
MPDPTLDLMLEYGLPAATRLLETLMRALSARDVATLDQLALVCPAPEVLRARDAALVLAARERNTAGLPPGAAPVLPRDLAEDPDDDSDDDETGGIR